MLHKGSMDLGRMSHSARVHAHKHVPMVGWQTVSFHFSVLYCPRQVHVVILTSLHSPVVAGELKGYRENGAAHTHCSTPLGLHAKLC